MAKRPRGGLWGTEEDATLVVLGGGGVRGLVLLVRFADLGDISLRLAKDDPKAGNELRATHIVNSPTHRAQSAGTRFGSSGTSFSECSEHFASLREGEWHAQVGLPPQSHTSQPGFSPDR